MEVVVLGLNRKKNSLDDLQPGKVWAIDPSDDEIVNYESVLNWLIGLSDDDYDKVVKVASIHRKAYGDAADVLGEPLDPTTFINQPDNHASSLADQYADKESHPTDQTLLDGDDDISAAFLADDDHDSLASAKQRKLAKAGTKVNPKTIEVKD